MRKRVSLKTVTIIDILEAINKDYGDITAVQIREKDGTFRKISYVELGRRTVDVSSNLIKWGIVQNDRIAIYSENRPEWSVALFGIICAAAIVVPIDIKLSETEVQFILSNSQARCIFVSEKYLNIVDKIKPSLPDLKYIIAIDNNERQDVVKLKDLKLVSEENKNRPIHEEDTALIIYTSGTTGVAKGVELTYRNLMFQVRSLSEIVHYKIQEQFLSILPLNHTLELTGGLIAPLYAGGCITYCDSLKPTHMLSLMQQTHTRMVICVPLVIKMLYDGVMDKVDKMPAYKRKMFNRLLNLSKWLLNYNIRIGRLLFFELHKQFGSKLCGFVSGGAPLDKEIEINFSALGFWVLQGYGLTETSPAIAVNTFETYRFGSVGKPLLGVEVKILKENSSSNDGEIITRGDHVMKGYFQNPGQTAEVIKEGWLHTGDIGRLDNDGFLYITGRIRNLIVLGAGKKVFPEEVEQVISRSPFIKEICVLAKIATKGLRKGCEEVYAVVVPNLDLFEESEKKDKNAIKNKINSEIARLVTNLAEYKRVIDFEIWADELPKTASRKIKRKVIADIITSASHCENKEI
ncbi:MAG: AMP-binding protein [Candidatus Omnitrophota bacterium]|nr:AMP-binding protein [Candidatus Omnitrophota bacterium]